MREALSFHESFAPAIRATRPVREARATACRSRTRVFTGRRPSGAARGGGIADEARREAAAQEEHSHHAEQRAPREDAGDRAEPLTGEDERGPVARVPQLRSGAQKAQLGEAQRLCLWLPAVQLKYSCAMKSRAGSSATRQRVVTAARAPADRSAPAERVRPARRGQRCRVRSRSGKGGESTPLKSRS